ncbi:MFS general substrate transporter [Cryphonectria parasitica EP155]|uniref:MFS general substrate transporter n=1 Tax=Cryphonectria parasitica (strain ATCC 38755 / EP155) TaxID=660469 RepID=A0A9P4Y6R4_CRYP1|nr:MFS general substrate transporter [Cryphonectria parasitica EP155]KAF3767979.1 MFS general substrate transporter [Cryphonectria parasitica EP155]
MKSTVHTGRDATITKANDDPFLVEFRQPFDSENPKDWPARRKWVVTDSLSASGFNRIMVSTIMAPALTTIQKELDMTAAESAMALSVYLLATAFGPLIIGPLSEVYGRKRVLHASNGWFILWNIVCGFANTKGLLISARFMAGFGASAIYALGGGVLGDIWTTEERGRGLRIYLTISVLGSAVGPIVGGYMAGRASWRWMFWATSIFQVLMTAVTWTTVRETFAPVILQRRAEKLRRDTGNTDYRTAYERLDDKKPLAQVLRQALTRPLRLLAFHPSLQMIGAMQAYNYGLLYVVLSRFATVWVEQYSETVETSGLHYISCALGEIVGSQVGGPLMDRFFLRMLKRGANDGGGAGEQQREHIPEFRLPLMLPGALVAPAGLLLYGWTAQYRVQWAAVDLGAFVYMFGSQLLGLPMQAYIIDAWPEHTGSALAATQFLRSMTAFAFPLFAPSMYAGLGYGWGNSVLSLVGVVLGVMCPLLLWRFGKRMRMRAGASY